MVTRRRVVIAFGAGVLAPLTSLAQQSAKVHRVGFLGPSTAAGFANRVEELRTALRELGYIEGKNVIYEER